MRREQDATANSNSLWADPWVVLVSDFPGDPYPEVGIYPTKQMAKTSTVMAKKAATVWGLKTAANAITEYYPARGTYLMEAIPKALNEYKEPPSMLHVQAGKGTRDIALVLRGVQN